MLAYVCCFSLAPMYDVVIDATVNYSEGDEVLVNCSSRSAQDIHRVSVEAYFQNNFKFAPGSAVEYGGIDANCAVGLFWTFLVAESAESSMSNAIILCKIENTLRNITRTAEKVITVT